MYIKHYWVSYPGMDRFLIESNEVPKTHPNIKGLDVKYWLTDDNGINYCLSVCDDDAILPSGNGVTQLTKEQWEDSIPQVDIAQNQSTFNTISSEEIKTLADLEKSIISEK